MGPRFWKCFTYWIFCGWNVFHTLDAKCLSRNCFHILDAVFLFLEKNQILSKWSLFHDQRPLTMGSKKGKSNHDDEYSHGQEKRTPSTYVEGENNWNGNSYLFFVYLFLSLCEVSKKAARIHSCQLNQCWGVYGTYLILL